MSRAHSALEQAKSQGGDRACSEEGEQEAFVGEVG
jgi:hypothetical protein